MRERLTRVTRKGQITIPAEIRKALGIQVGDTVAVSLAEDQTAMARLVRAGSVAERTFGAVTPRRKPEDLKELRRQFIESLGQEEAPARSPKERKTV
jgi:antitoxin PrlF